MVTAIVGQGPPLAKSLHPGRLVKLLQASKTQVGYNHRPPVNRVLRVHSKYSWKEQPCVYLQDELTGTTYGTTELDSVFAAVSRREKAEYRDELTKLYISGKRSLGGNGCGGRGTDPEVFVVNGEGEIIPAYLFLPSKAAPLYMKGALGDVKAFYDGFQAEFTVGVAGCHENLCHDVRLGLKSIYEAAKKLDPTAKLTHQCVLDLPEHVWATTPAEQRVLGCDPSSNVYFEGPNPRLGTAEELPFRFAGCHLHYAIGSDQSLKAKQGIVKLLDAISGVCSVSLLRGLEDPRRRAFYGLAGEYRLPQHGLEWRTLSSAILIHPVVWHLVCDLSRKVVAIALSDQAFIWDCSADEAQQVINDLNVPLAEEIIHRNEKALHAILLGTYGAQEVIEKSTRLILEGAENCLPSLDVVANWHLNEAQWPRQPQMRNTTLKAKP